MSHKINEQSVDHTTQPQGVSHVCHAGSVSALTQVWHKDNLAKMKGMMTAMVTLIVERIWETKRKVPVTLCQSPPLLLL